MGETEQQDLDLIYVLRKMRSTGKNTINGIGSLIEFSWRNAGKLALFIAVAIGVGTGLYSLKREYYASTMSVAHIRVENDYCREMIIKLNSELDGKDNPSLTAELGLSPEQAKMVRAIKYYDLNENVAKKYLDSTKVLLPFKIEAQVFDLVVLDSLQTGIIRYMESNVLAQKLKTLELSAINRTEERILHEISEIDSLKRIVNGAIIPRSNGNGIVFGEPVDPVQVYGRSMELFEKKILLNKKQALNNSFEVAVPFNKIAKRADAGAFTYLLVSILIGYFLGVLWLYRRQNG